LLGHSGSILKELTKVLRAKITILGKGSMKDKKKEEELSVSEEAEHAHLKEPLHVLIDIKAPRAEAHRRMADTLADIYQFTVPVEQQAEQQQKFQQQQQQQQQQRFNQMSFDPSYGGGFPGEYGGEYGGGFHRPLPPRGRGVPRGAARGRGGRGAPRY